MTGQRKLQDGSLTRNFLVVIAALVLLVACSVTDDEPATDYLNRLHNVLGVATFEQLTRAMPDYPAPRELKLQSESGELSIREFLSLRECEFHKVVAERNSLIGKVAVASQRLFNDLAMLATGPTCVEILSNGEQKELAKKLNEFLDFKRNTIQTSLWQALLGDAENAQFWGAGAKLDNYPETLTKESLPDIQALTEFAASVNSGQFAYSAEQTQKIEKHLGGLRYGDGGRLLREYALIVESLERANRAVQRRLVEPLCMTRQDSDPAPNANARNFQNVVNKFFVNQVQLHAVELNRRHAQLIPAYQQLEAQLETSSPPAYKEWVAKRQALIQQGQEASKRHAQYVGKLFEQCGLTPGTSPS